MTLPPSFKGVAVRYVYQLEASAQFAVPKGLASMPSIPLSSSAAVLGEGQEASKAAAAPNDVDQPGPMSTSAGKHIPCPCPSWSIAQHVPCLLQCQCLDALSVVLN
jgi:hypothetical protein